MTTPSDYDWPAAFVSACTEAARLRGDDPDHSRAQAEAALANPRPLTWVDDQDADDIAAERAHEQGARLAHYYERHDR